MDLSHIFLGMGGMILKLCIRCILKIGKKGALLFLKVYAIHFDRDLALITKFYNAFVKEIEVLVMQPRCIPQWSKHTSIGSQDTLRWKGPQGSPSPTSQFHTAHLASIVGIGKQNKHLFLVLLFNTHLTGLVFFFFSNFEMKEKESNQSSIHLICIKFQNNLKNPAFYNLCRDLSCVKNTLNCIFFLLRGYYLENFCYLNSDLPEYQIVWILLKQQNILTL